MGKIILENITHDEISQNLQDAGVGPDKRVTVEVGRQGDLCTPPITSSIRSAAEPKFFPDNS